jgi:hypothetical protein
MQVPKRKHYGSSILSTLTTPVNNERNRPMRNFHIGGRNDVRSAHKIHFQFKAAPAVMVVAYGVDAALHTGFIMMVAYFAIMMIEGKEMTIEE